MTTKPFTLICLRHGGTHMIQPIIRRLTGRPVYAPKGIDALVCEPSPKVVVFTRDPRNVVVSMARYKSNGHLTPGKADRRIAKILRRVKNGQTPVFYMSAWAKAWWQRPGVLYLSFEQMNAERERCVTLVRDYLDAGGDVEDAIDYTFGRSGTWTGRHSDWREWFGNEAHAAWAETGGAECVRLMGYR